MFGLLLCSRKAGGRLFFTCQVCLCVVDIRLFSFHPLRLYTNPKNLLRFTRERICVFAGRDSKREKDEERQCFPSFFLGLRFFWDVPKIRKNRRNKARRFLASVGKKGSEGGGKKNTEECVCVCVIG